MAARASSAQEHHNARDVILHIMLRVPFLRCAFNQLLAAIFGVLLSLVKKLDGLGHLRNLYLV